MKSTCPFCAIEPHRIVRENDQAVALQDGFPVSEGHVLIVPRRHVQTWFDATAQEQQAMLALLDQVKAETDARLAPVGYNVGFNAGAAAGQTVMHCHLHVIPRYAGDSEDPRGGVRWVLPKKAAYWNGP